MAAHREAGDKKLTVRLSSSSHQRRRPEMKRVGLLGLLLMVSLLVACGAGESETGAGELVVENVWGRNSPMSAANGAFYMTLINNTAEEERLLSAAADVCGVVELHEMYMKEGDVMGMRPVPDGYITIPPGETVELKVGGLHVMCINKTRALELGEQIDLTLNFSNAGERIVPVEIRESDEGM
jgi:periplasmic copper chaperone A